MNIVAAAPYLWDYFPLDHTELRKILEAMHAALKAKSGKTVGNLEVLITDDAGIEEANLTHLHCAGPTNILSFSSRAGGVCAASDGGAAVGGSLLLSVSTLRRESLLYGQDQAEHAVHLLAHGLAHLAGCEHGPEMWDLCEMMEDAGRGVYSALRRTPARKSDPGMGYPS